jgi:hypothetical protein
MFENEPEKRKQIISDLKEFTENGDMYKLTNSLNELLKTPQHRVILTQIKSFIPLRQQALFEHLTTKASSSLVVNPSGLNSNRELPEILEPASNRFQKPLDVDLKDESEDSESIPSGVR